MKKIWLLFLVSALFSCGNSIETKKENTARESEVDRKIALEVLNDYVASCNALEDPEKWVSTNPLLTADFKSAYQKMIKDAREEDPELGLGFDPIFNAQDYPDKGFTIASGKSSDDSVVVLEGIDMKMTVKVRLKAVNGKWLVDGAGVIRMDDK
ncbi:hypothetical protein [Fluviicola sp.]|uniref:hypothetical protein n=1 Tax=Fluviicola sp. TaxID=1917219 RepID=UPI0031DDC3C9